jgi:hypothetical protein
MTMRVKESLHPIRDAILFIDLFLACHTAFLKRIPVLRLLYRTVTADLLILPPVGGVALGFKVEFRSPYFRVPVSVDKSQIGQAKMEQWLEPGAFRLFDWQTWAHIDGSVEWHGERCMFSKGQQLDLITGFGYRVPELPEGIGNLGLRLAEGVEGNLRIGCGSALAQVSFEPGFWLLDATLRGFRPIPIKSYKLMGLIVALFDIASGNRRIAGRAVSRLRQWVECNIGAEKPFTGTRKFLGYVRDWGPLGRGPLCQGIIDVIEQLQVADIERELFDFVADNWGIWSNRNGRVLAVRLLGTLNTRPAKAALEAIYEFVRHGDVSDEELHLIRSVAGKGTLTAGSGPTATE